MKGTDSPHSRNPALEDTAFTQTTPTKKCVSNVLVCAETQDRLKDRK